jgi:hypothetical protein
MSLPPIMEILRTFFWQHSNSQLGAARIFFETRYLGFFLQIHASGELYIYLTGVLVLLLGIVPFFSICIFSYIYETLLAL